jgi:hypothetical protein
MSMLSKPRLAGALLGVVLSGALSVEAVAGPMSFTPARDLAVQPITTQIKYKAKKKHHARHHARRHGNAAAAAMLGLFAAGVGAAIANSHRRDYYYGYPDYYYGGPAYYGYSRPYYRHHNGRGRYYGPYQRNHWR